MPTRTAVFGSKVPLIRNVKTFNIARSHVVDRSPPNDQPNRPFTQRHFGSETVYVVSSTLLLVNEDGSLPLLLPESPVTGHTETIATMLATMINVDEEK